MHRFTVVSLAVAVLCAWTPAQEMGGAPQEEKACDLAKTEVRDYCAGCKAWPAADQIEKGACKKCKAKIDKAETCIKVCWVCPKMHGGKPQRHAKDCCGAKGCCTETPILALVWYSCDGCPGKAMKEADVKHADKCAGKVKKSCAESNTFPHGGTE